MAISSFVLPSAKVGSFQNQQAGALLTGIQGQSAGYAPSVAAVTAAANATPEQVRTQNAAQRAIAFGQRQTQYAQLAAQRAAQARAARQARSSVSSGGGSVNYGDSSIDVSGPRGGHYTAAIRGRTTARGMSSPGLGASGLYANAESGYEAMSAAMQKAGLGGLGIREGRRTYARQAQLYALYKAGKGNLAARPGTSIHETGRAADFNIYRGSKQFNWMVQNAAQFGWVWTGRTFSQVEPWHWEYVGQ